MWPPHLEPMSETDMKRVLAFACAVTALVQLASVPIHAQLGTPLGNAVELKAGDQRYRVVPVADGLTRPWSIGFLPDGRTMLVTEEPGRLRIVRDGELEPEPAWEAPLAPASTDPDANDSRLRAVAVHPQRDAAYLPAVAMR